MAAKVHCVEWYKLTLFKTDRNSVVVPPLVAGYLRMNHFVQFWKKLLSQTAYLLFIVSSDKNLSCQETI